MALFKNSVLNMRKVRFSIADTKFRPTSNTTERLINAEWRRKCALKVQELDKSFKF